MTSRNIIFHAAMVGALLPIGLWAAAEMATPGSALLNRLPNLANSNLWFCMILMIVCSLAIPAGRSRFNRGQSLLITLTATLTCLVAFGSLPGLLVLDAPDAPVRIAAYVIEALMGGLALLALGVARTDESRGMESNGNWSHVAALSLVQPQPFTVGRLASHAVLESTCSGSSPSSRST